MVILRQASRMEMTHPPALTANRNAPRAGPLTRAPPRGCRGDLALPRINLSLIMDKDLGIPVM
jgi:hypothetical protein